MAKMYVSSMVQFSFLVTLSLVEKKSILLFLLYLYYFCNNSMSFFYYCLTHHCVCLIYVAQSLLLVFYIGSGLDNSTSGKFPHTKDALTSNEGDNLLAAAPNPELDH